MYVSYHLLLLSFMLQYDALSQPKSKCKSGWRKKTYLFLESFPVQALLMTCLFLSLFFADVWIMENPPDSADVVKDTILTTVLVLFLIETTMYSLCQEAYFLGFYFWMDVVGTLSIILDLSYVTDAFDARQGKRTGSYLRAVRAAKLGARYGRLMRFFKFMKYLRHLPCFHNSEVAEPSMNAVRKVANELSHTLIRMVAFLTLLLVIVIPFIEAPNRDRGVGAYMDILQFTASSDGTTTGIINPTVNFMNTTDNFRNFMNDKSPLIYMSVSGEYVFDGTTKTLINVDRSKIRKDNIHDYNRVVPGGNIDLSVDYTQKYYWESAFGVILMVMVIIIFLVYSISFQIIIDEKVNAPLEKSTKALRNCAEIMLKSMKAMEIEKEKDVEAMKELDDLDDDLDQDLETEMLEKLIERLAGIVQHVIPGAEKLIVDKNVDSSTAKWLNEAYLSKATKMITTGVNKIGGKLTQAVELVNIQKKLSSNTVVSNELLNSWHFNVLDYSKEELLDIAHVLFGVFNVFDRFKVEENVFSKFMVNIADHYIDHNTYHNFKHGCDVLHACYLLSTRSKLHRVCSQLEMFSLLTAAIAHDVGHLGVNNVYLVKARHKLALRHNDKSPLENMHCAVLYEILGEQDANIFSSLTETEWRESRKIILTCILGTDMSHHFEQISKVNLFLEVHGSETESFAAGNTEEIPQVLHDSDQRLFMMELLLHCSDISNPYKPFQICRAWSHLVVAEFCAQGDREKKEGLEVSPMCDRDAMNLCNMQMGFIEFVVSPLILGVIKMFPSLHGIGSTMNENMREWAAMRVQEIDESNDMDNKETEKKKLTERLQNFDKKCIFLDELKSKCVE